MKGSELSLQPRWVDTGLLVLRLGAGFSLFFLFGMPKVHDAFAYLHPRQWAFADFNRKVGLPAPVLVAFCQKLNESLAALLVAFGLMTRLSAGCLALGFAVATHCSLKVGEQAWLMAAYFCLMFLTLLLAGPGRFSMDRILWSGVARQIGNTRDGKSVAKASSVA